MLKEGFAQARSTISPSTDGKGDSHVGTNNKSSIRHRQVLLGWSGRRRFAPCERVTSSSSFGFWRIKNDDEECGDGPQEKRHNPPIQTASALGLREARVYEGESRPANCILTCFPNHHQTPRGIRQPARILSSPKRPLLQKPVLITAGIMQKRKISQGPLCCSGANPLKVPARGETPRRSHRAAATTHLFARACPADVLRSCVRGSGRGGACRRHGKEIKTAVSQSGLRRSWHGRIMKRFR